MTRIFLEKWCITRSCRSIVSGVAERKPVSRHVDGRLYKIFPFHFAVLFPGFVESFHLPRYPGSRRTYSTDKYKSYARISSSGNTHPCSIGLFLFLFLFFYLDSINLVPRVLRLFGQRVVASRDWTGLGTVIF